ncbi:HDOD domain-containing protein [Gallaecimonas kandeliae]|uniref:HDOD domain-containing protein n=1 Tax=Gallaecimonas kandeliae TaxID=3029055 RepID=UPI00264A097C|nr:HDOD domain-containing protein [Gallaecimonas kandeliae]WKE66363.1 HDOD domain-containing protein [Gallaecimonas kandeliae]
MANENDLLASLIDKIKKNALILPTLPEVALQVRTATEKNEISMEELADIIRQDPALAARVIKVANSAHYRRAMPVDSIQGALARIGMQQIRSLVTAAAMQQLFICTHPIIEDVMMGEWEESVCVSSAACLLLKDYLARGGANPRNLTVDGAQLSGLIHNIGVLPILAEAEEMPDAITSPYLLKKVLNRLAQPLGLNILRNWGFGEDQLKVVKYWKDGAYDASEPDYASFVRLGALACGLLQRHGLDTEALTKDAVAKGLLRSETYFDEPAFTEPFNELKEAFDL